MATTGQTFNTLATGEYLTICKIIPAGALQARKTSAGGINFYWRFTHGGGTDREPLGPYDSSAPPKSTVRTTKGYSIEAARRAAEIIAGEHHLNRELGGHAALKSAKRKANANAAAAALHAAEFTLSKLLDEYCAYLKSNQQPSHGDVRSMFRLHVKDAFPAIAALPARDITMEHVVDIMRRLHDVGKKRTSNKVRSYMRSAYQIARASHSTAAIPEKFKSFGVKHNPVADTVGDASANKRDKNPLSVEEMRLYWSLIKNMPGFKGALLRLHLLTGAQRIEQLVNLKTSEVHQGWFLLWDTKGKGDEPRRNGVPLTLLAQQALDACAPSGFYALSTTGGEKRVGPTTLSGWACDVVGERIPAFKAKRLRSGVETLLAKAKESKEVRGRLQSHGISGVQDANYNDYDYLDEKLKALEKLELWLTSKPEVTKSGPAKQGPAPDA